MNRKRYYRYRHHCFPTALAAAAKMVVVVAVVLSPMVSCGVVTLRPRKHSSHETVAVNRQPAVGARPCSRIITRSPAADKGHYRSGTFEKGHYRFANTGTRRRHKLFVARLDDVTDEADTTATDATTTSAPVNGSSGSKPTELPRCFKIKFTTPRPITKRWSPRIKKCSRIPDTANRTTNGRSTTNGTATTAASTANATDAVDGEDRTTVAASSSDDGASGNSTATDNSACDDDATVDATTAKDDEKTADGNRTTTADDDGGGSGGTTATDDGGGTTATDDGGGTTATDDAATTSDDAKTAAETPGNGTATTVADDACTDDVGNATTTAVPEPSSDRATAGRKGRKTTHRRKPSKTTTVNTVVVSKSKCKSERTASPVKPFSGIRSGGGGNAFREPSVANAYRPCDDCDYYK